MITISYSDYETLYNIRSENLIPEGRFAACLAKAEAFLSSFTMGRLSQADDADRTARCLCEIAELFYLKSARFGIASENNDGYSVSYSGTATEKAAADIASAYLAQTGLLYRGIG